MNAYKKLIIQSLIVLIFVVLIYREWGSLDARLFYVKALALCEIIVEFIYLRFNRNSLKEVERSRIIIAILLYAIVLVGVTLLNLLKTVS